MEKKRPQLFTAGLGLRAELPDGQGKAVRQLSSGGPCAAKMTDLFGRVPAGW